MIDSSLVLPRVRSDIEDQCNRIAKGQASKESVVKKAVDLFSRKYDAFVRNIEKMDVLFGSAFSKLEDVGKPFTRCGHTRIFTFSTLLDHRRGYITGTRNLISHHLFAIYTDSVFRAIQMDRNGVSSSRW